MIRSAAIQTSTAVARQGTRRARGLTPAISTYATRCVTSSSSHAVGGRRRRKPTGVHATSSSAALIENHNATDDRPSRMRRRLSSLSAQQTHSDSGASPGLLQSNTLASQYLGAASAAASSLQSSRADLLRHDPAHSEALTRLVRTLLNAPSAVIDSSLAVGVGSTAQQEETAISMAEPDTNAIEEQNEQAAQHMNKSEQEDTRTTTFVSDGWGELDQAPLRKEAASLADDDDIATNADADTDQGDASSPWFEEQALLQDQEEKHTKRKMLRNAKKVRDIFFSICEPRQAKNGKMYQPRLHIDSAMDKFRFLVEVEQDDHPIMKDFVIDMKLYPMIIRAMPRRFLGPKMEVLRKYVAAAEAKARNEQQKTLDEDGNAEGGSSKSGDVDLVLDLDSDVLYNCCESPGAYSHRQRKRGSVDKDANSSIMDSICFLGDTLINTPKETQHKCLPALMASALTTKNEQNAWTYAADIFWHMDEQRFPIDYKMYNHIACNSTFRNTQHFPFWKVLKVLAHDKEARKAVDMCDVIQLLVNHFPYTDASATKSVMRSILSLHQPEPDNENDSDGEEDESDETITFPSFDSDVSFPLNCNVHADRGVLQAIAYAGATAGDPDMVLMAWDLADQAGYSPSAEMYESIVTAFASSHKQDHNAFAALCEMEEAEIPVSRALIESFSTQVGYTPGRIKNARFILTNETEGTAITTSSLNVVMAALAGRGDAEGSFETFALYEHYGVEPNADTYSYMIESLATNMTSEQNGKSEEDLSTKDYSQNVAAAREVLNEAREAGVSSGNILHQYLRALCAANCLEEAVETLEQAVKNKERVLMESFSLLAVRHAKEGLFETAERICKKVYKRAGYGKMPRNVIGRIRNIQKNPKKQGRQSFHQEEE